MMGSGVVVIDDVVGSIGAVTIDWASSGMFAACARCDVARRLLVDRFLVVLVALRDEELCDELCAEVLLLDLLRAASAGAVPIIAHMSNAERQRMI